jgi:NADH-quinone oxidoreductase subunit E
MCGAYRIADYLEAKLGVKLGETTPDGVFTIHEVECLDACDRAQVLQVGDQYVGPVTEADIDALLDRLRNEDSSAVVQLADSIVQVHLRDTERAK